MTFVMLNKNVNKNIMYATLKKVITYLLTSLKVKSKDDFSAEIVIIRLSLKMYNVPFKMLVKCYTCFPCATR